MPATSPAPSPAVVVPIYKTTLTPAERVSIDRTAEVLAAREVFLVGPARLQAHLQALAAGYGPRVRHRTFDDRFCTFLGISWETFTGSVRAGGSDEEILEPCLAAGRRPDAEQIEVWNTFMQKRGWRDSGTPSFLRSKEEAGLSHRDDLLTFFDLMDVEEGRKP